MRFNRKIRFATVIPFQQLVGVGLMLTRRCNLNCLYCKVRSEESDDLDVGQWKEIISKLHTFGHRHFVFTGGEPLLYPNALDLIEWTFPRAITSLISNGTLLSDTLLERISFLDFLSISVDGLSDDGPFVKSRWDIIPRAIEMGRRNGFTVETITVITALNVEEVPEIARRASKMGCDVLLSIIHSGSGEQEFRKHVPELEFRTMDDLRHLERTRDELLAMKRAGYRIAESEAYLHDMINFVKGQFQMPCHAGRRWLEVSNDGRLLPCHDGIKSDLMAWDIENEDEMRQKLMQLVPKGCNCFYDCYYNYAYRRKHPWRSFWQLLRRFSD